MLFWLWLFFTAFCLFVCAVNVAQVFLVREERKPFLSEDEFPKVTLICCAWNEERVIERKIKNYLEQDYPRDKLEIVIVDNGSDDKTGEICKKYAREGLIKLIRLEKHAELKATALDYAIKNFSKGEVIAHVDADGLCKKDWLRRIVSDLYLENADAVCGKIFCGNYYRNVLAGCRGIEDLWMYWILPFARYRLTGQGHIIGANYAVRRKSLEEVGFHGEKTLVEDSELMLKLIASGKKVAVSSASVWQEEVETLSDYLKQRKRWYGGAWQVSKAYGKEMRKILKEKPFWFLLMFCASLFPLCFSYAFFQTVFAILWARSFASALPAILIYVMGALGNIAIVLKSGNPSLLKYVLPYLFVDHFVWLFCNLLVLAYLALGKKIRWEKVPHRGVPLRIWG